MFSYVDNFKNIFEKMEEWYEHNPIPPSMYPIEGLKMYKFQHNNNQQEEINIDINLFKEKSIRYTKRNINLIEFILNSKIIILLFLETSIEIDHQFENYIDLTDFKFVSCDNVIYKYIIFLTYFFI